MDLQTFFFTSMFLITSLIIIITITLNTNKKSPKLPPGPKKLPIIGNLHQLIGSLPHHRLRDLSRIHGPIMHLQLGEISTVIVSSPEFAEQIMKTHDLIFASRPHILAMDILFYKSTSTAFSPYGDYWRRVKKISTMELLGSNRVQSFRSIREEEVFNLIDWIKTKSNQSINFTSKIHSVSNAIVLRTAFGMKCDEEDSEIRLLKQETIEALSGFSIVDLFPSIEMLQWLTGIRGRLEKLHRKIDGILQNIIEQHKQAKTTSKTKDNKDLVDVLLKIQKEGHAGFHLTNDNIKAVIWDILLGGTDTPATTLNWAMSELMKNPTLMKKTQDEVRETFDRIGKLDETAVIQMKFLKAVLKETLRLHPPGVLLAPRECRERCQIHGFEIPIKTKVMINAWAIGRDPDYWNEPNNFIPERFFNSSLDYRGTNFKYIPFGAGRRMCPGISFATANMELLLARILYHFDWKLPNGMKPEDLDLTEKFGISVERKGELNLIPILHGSSFI